jgi:hypothetical protein
MHHTTEQNTIRRESAGMELTGYPIAFVSQSKPFYKAMEADFSL